MRTIAVSNLSNSPITLGGEEIEEKTQATVSSLLLKEEEFKTIMQSGNTITRTHALISVVAIKANEDKDKVLKVVEHFAFPTNCITTKGEISKGNNVKDVISDLQEAHDGLILSDNEFKELYPAEDIEAYRVEVEENE
ncbi:MAG: hypothetical protein GQ474_00575 [Sulfurimonas sp.]|nr:hypothetical protein [Sulfurimonas sp.]